MRKLFLAAVVSAACAGPALADGPLSGADLQKMVPGHYHVAVGTLVIDVNLAKGGKVSGTTNGGDADQGHWHIAGNRMCVKFKKWLDKQEKCEALSMVGNEIKGSVFSAWRK